VRGNWNGHRGDAQWVREELTAALATKNACRKLTNNLNDIGGLIIELYAALAILLVTVWTLLVVVGWAKSTIFSEWLKPKQERRFSWRLACWIVVWATAIALAVFLVTGIVSSSQALTSLAPDTNSGTDDTDVPSIVLYIITVAVIFCPAILYTIMLTVTALVRKRPVLKSLISATAAISPPIITTLLIINCGLLLFYVKQDDDISRSLINKVKYGEAQYASKLSGNPWPGLVSEPKPAI
jgi:hypothetical protein